MIKYILSLSVFFVGTSAQAACQSFKQGQLAVVVMGEPYATRNAWITKATTSAKKGLEQLGAVAVTSFYGVRTEIEKAYQKCILIKDLRILAHGKPGAMGVGNEVLNEFTAQQFFGNLDHAFSKDANIDMDGCNVGKGCEGSNLMKKIADLTLTKGGKVRAAATLRWPGIDWVWLKAQELQVHGNGSEQAAKWKEDLNCQPSVNLPPGILPIVRGSSTAAR